MKEMKEEIWKNLTDIVEFGQHYEVSNLGNIRRVGKNNTRKLVKDKDGYLTINFANKGKVKGYKVHRLVALAFIPNPDNKPEINHINCIRNDNRYENLEWVTNRENIDYAVKNGSMVGNKLINFEAYQGERNGNARLYDSIVFQIVEDWNTGLYTQDSLSIKYEISREAISSIVREKSWNHLSLRIKDKRKKGTTNPLFLIKVVKLNLNGELISVYDSLRDGARDVNGDVSKISAVCKGKRKTHAGFVWMYLKDYENKG